ncbi:MAG TPA: NAD-dependent epimerase/dehydratase family protein [Gemmatimonadaceae bacterium]|jgi:nucleoside-diphosphate-sugar epimerase
MTILVTGATGFLGSAIFDLAMASRLPVRGMARRVAHQDDASIVPGDILDADAVERALTGASSVIHTAGLAHVFTGRATTLADFERTNVQGTATVMKTAVRLSIPRVILVSSVSVYGHLGDAVCDEATPCKPTNPYGASKLAAEQVAADIVAGTDTQLAILRMATLYGERDPGNVMRLIRAIDRRRFVWLGDGRNRKSLVYRDDAARACLVAADHAWRSPTNVANVSAPPHTIRQVVDTIATNLGRRMIGPHLPARPIMAALSMCERVGPLADRSKRLSRSIATWLSDDVYSGDRFAAEVGFVPRMALDEGIGREVAYYRQQRTVTWRR